MDTPGRGNKPHVDNSMREFQLEPGDERYPQLLGFLLGTHLVKGCGWKKEVDIHEKAGNPDHTDRQEGSCGCHRGHKVGDSFDFDTERGQLWPLWPCTWPSPM